MTEDRRVAVIGLGYVGLPLAISFVEAGLTVVGVDAFAGRVAELNAGTSPIDDISDERLRTALSAASACAPRPRPILRPSMRSSSASRPRSPRPRIPTSAPVLSAAETIRGSIRAGPAHRAPVDDVPGHHDRPVPRGHRAQRPHGRHRLRPRLRAGTREPGRSGQCQQGDPAAGRGGDARRHLARGGPAADHQRQRHRAHLARRRRAGEAARERLPQREHRVRQPARAAVRADGSRCLGGHQRRGHEALRLHEVHAGPGRRRALHPGRSVLPRVARPRVRLHRPVHRARRGHQLRDAAARGRPRGRGAQRPRQGAEGGEGRHPRRGVQAERPRRPQLAGGRRHRRYRGARRRRPVPRSARRRVHRRCRDRARARRSTTCSAGPTPLSSSPPIARSIGARCTTGLGS